MMHQNGTFLQANFNNFKFEALMVAFKDHYKMLILMPHNGTKLLQVWNVVDKFGLKSIIGRMQKRTLALSMPLIELISRTSVAPVLNEFDLLVDKYSAEPSNDAVKPNVLLMSRVNLAETDYIDAENEAPAAPDTVEGSFIVNRPFMFLILDDNTNDVVFAGQIQLGGVFVAQ